MILRLLRIFPQFCALESLCAVRAQDLREANADIEQLTTEKLVLKGRADAECEARLKAEAALDRIERELNDWKCIAGAREAEIQRLNAELRDEAHKVADTMSIHAIGKRVFSKATDQPVAAPQMQPMVGRQFARDVQMQKMQDTRKALREMWDRIPTEQN